MHWTILQRDPMPTTVNKWQAAAWRRVQHRRMVFASLGSHGGDFLSTRQNRRQDPPRRPQVQQPQRDPNIMDVNVVSFRKKEGTGGGGRNSGSLSKEECLKRLNEGQCFQCSRQGHQKMNCPTRTVPAAAKGADGRGGGQCGGKVPRPERKAKRARPTNRKRETATHLDSLLPTTPRPSSTI